MWQRQNTGKRRRLHRNVTPVSGGDDAPPDGAFSSEAKMP
jgi:hypothetical protein